MPPILLLLVLHVTVKPCYSKQSNKFMANNGEDVTLSINISNVPTAGFLYLNDPHDHIVGVYTASGVYPGLLYNTSGGVTVDGSLITVTIPSIDKTRHAGTFTCGYMHQRQLLPNCGALLVVRDTPTEPKIRLLQNAVYGYNVTLKCLSNSTTLPERDQLRLRFDWFQDDLQLQTGAQFKMTRSRLTFNVTHRGVHNFGCIARDGTLKTNLVKTEFLPEYAPYDVNINASELIQRPEGSPLTVSCTAVCKPLCRYEWSHQGNRRHGTENGILHFAHIARRYAGNYKCIASNEHGSQESSIVLDVSYPPTCNIKGPEKNIVNEGQRILLQCQTDSNPAPVVTWLKDGFIVAGNYTRNETESNGGVIKQVYTYEHMKKDAKCQDSGLYSCRVNNGIQPSAEKTLRLLVNCPIRQIRNSRSLEKFIRPIQSTLIVNRSIMAFPKPRVVGWAIVDQGMKRVLNETRFTTVWSTGSIGYMHTLTLKHAKLLAADDGKYSVELNNDAGPNSFLSYDVIVQASPDAPSDLTVLYLNDDSVTVGWTKGHNRNAEQRFEITMTYEGNKSVTQWTGEETTQTTFENLENGTEYIIRVRARNNFGTSDYSPVLRVKIGTAMGVPDFGISQDETPRYDKEGPLWSVTILGIVGLSLVILLVVFFCMKCLLKKVGSHKRTPPQPPNQQGVSNQEYDGLAAMSAGTSSGNIYDEIETTESQPSSNTYLRPACSVYIRHTDPRRTISAV